MYLGGVAKGTRWVGNRGVILNKNIKTIHGILYVLFHVEDVGDTLYDFNRLNSMHVGRCQRRTVLYFYWKLHFTHICGCLSEMNRSRALHILENNSTL